MNSDIPKSMIGSRIGWHWMRFKAAHPKIFPPKKRKLLLLDFDFSTEAIGRLKETLVETHDAILHSRRSLFRTLYTEIALMCWITGWIVYDIFQVPNQIFSWVAMSLTASLAATIYNFRRTIILLEKVTTTHVLFHVQEEGLESLLNDMKNE